MRWVKTNAKIGFLALKDIENGLNHNDGHLHPENTFSGSLCLMESHIILYFPYWINPDDLHRITLSNNTVIRHRAYYKVLWRQYNYLKTVKRSLIGSTTHCNGLWSRIHSGIVSNVTSNKVMSAERPPLVGTSTTENHLDVRSERCFVIALLHACPFIKSSLTSISITVHPVGPSETLTRLPWPQ